MLPISRNETHDNTTTIKPSTIDDIQDCIIGAKHGASSVTVHASAFNTMAQSGFSWSPLQGSLIWSLDNRLAFAPVQIPRGVQISGIDWVVDKNGKAAPLRLVVVAKQLGSPMSGLNIQGFDTSSGVGFHEISFSGAFTVPDIAGVTVALFAGFFAGSPSPYDVDGIALESATVRFARP